MNKRNKKKIALITGVTGQDGSYLAEFLLNKKYIVHGVKRRTSMINTNRIDHIYEKPQARKNFFLHYSDLTDSSSIYKIINKIKPDEIYNLAAQSHVAVSFENPEYTTNVNANGTLKILDAIRAANLAKHTKFYQASTSELFGKVQEIPQSETTPFYPRSPYGVSKLYSYWITVNYRESYNMFACNGILFNHESPRRGETFVTKKIAIELAKIFHGIDNTLYIGNLDAKRDWGHAKEYVEMQWRMLQLKNPVDLVIATGKQYTVRNFINECAKTIGIEIKWSGKGIKEVGIVKKIIKKQKYIKLGQKIVKVDKKYFRPSEVESLLGNPTKAKKILKWKPKISFSQLVKEMISDEIRKYEG